MISLKSLITFFYLNVILVTMSLITYFFALKYANQYIIGFLLMFVKNLLFVFGIEKIVSKKTMPKISQQKKQN